MTKLYFTLKGADRIMAQKQKLMDDLKETQGKKAEAAEVGGNQWHDNFAFEQLMRDEDFLNGQIKAINLIISQMIVISEPTSSDTSKLRIGHIAELDVEGELRTYQVGGYEDSDSSTEPPMISYLAPIVCQFIGQRQGHSEKLSISGRKKVVTLKKISIPERKEALNDNRS